MLPIRQIVSNARRVLPGFRSMSSSGPLVGVEVDNEGIATITMQRPPVNSFNLEMLYDVNKALDEVAKTKCKAMILTSFSPTVFTAGLDIMEFYKPDVKRLETLWTTLQEMWIKLFGANYITAAAINGHAPAGGCLLSLSCEYRVMVNGKFSIGLNDTALGIVAPKWFMDTVTHTLAKRDAEVALTASKMFSVDEALKVGLIDEIAIDKADCVAKCKAFIKKFDTIPPLARAITKQRIREAPLAWLQKNRARDTKEFIDLIINPNVQQSLEIYIQRLKNKAA